MKGWHRPSGKTNKREKADLYTFYSLSCSVGLVRRVDNVPLPMVPPEYTTFGRVLGNECSAAKYLGRRPENLGTERNSFQSGALPRTLKRMSKMRA